MLHHRGCNLGLASRSGSDLELERVVVRPSSGTVYVIRTAMPHMLGCEGDVVTLAAEAERRGLPYLAVYCASKFGQVGLTRALDHDLREQGIRCTNICPGGVATDFALEQVGGPTTEGPG